jgi:plastocyanin
MTRAIRTALPFAMAGVLSFGLAACGGSSTSKTANGPTTNAPAATETTTTSPPATTAPTTPGTTPAASAAVTVHIKNLTFSPSQVQLKTGQTITIFNDDSVPHTFTADAGGFDSGIISPGQSATVTITGTGTVGYHCKIHTTMMGSIQITA